MAEHSYPDNQVYISNLPESIEKGDLYHMFSEIGLINDVKVVKDPKTQRNKGIAFVSFKNSIDMQRSVNKFNNIELGGRHIKVQVSRNEKNSFEPEPTQSKYSPKRPDPAPVFEERRPPPPYIERPREFMEKEFRPQPRPPVYENNHYDSRPYPPKRTETRVTSDFESIQNRVSEIEKSLTIVAPIEILIGELYDTNHNEEDILYALKNTLNPVDFSNIQPLIQTLIQRVKERRSDSFR